MGEAIREATELVMYKKETETLDATQAMDVPAFWDLQCAAVEAANARSPMNDGRADVQVGDL